jgi:hypothetical protein
MEVLRPQPMAWLQEDQLEGERSARRIENVLLINNQRPSAHPIMPVLNRKLKTKWGKLELVAIRSGSNLDQISKASTDFDAAVIGVGD